MKDILVEFKEYGAVIHKDSAIIASLMDVPHCFFNPDLSKVAGVSPSFWALSESGEIIKASQEEIERRKQYHASKPPEAPSLKTTLDDLKQEIMNEMEVRQEEVEEIKTDLYSIINDMSINYDRQNKDFNISLDFVVKQITEINEINKSKLKQINKQLYVYKIGLAILYIMALLGAIK